MNALANSQLGELEKFLGTVPSNQPVSFARYTGQENDGEARSDHREPARHPAHQLRDAGAGPHPPARARLVKAAKDLWFLVLDELHTYRGRQGADVALLVRRLQDACAAPDVQCVGTSATMTTEAARGATEGGRRGRGHARSASRSSRGT